MGPRTFRQAVNKFREKPFSVALVNRLCKNGGLTNERIGFLPFFLFISILGNGVCVCVEVLCCRCLGSSGSQPVRQVIKLVNPMPDGHSYPPWKYIVGYYITKGLKSVTTHKYPIVVLETL